MKKLFKLFLLLTVIGAVTISGCKKDEPNPDPDPEEDQGTLRLMVDNRAMDLTGGMQDLQLDTFGYKTLEGDTISFDHIKYFISNVGLVRSAGDTEFVSNIYWLKTQNSSDTSYRSMLDISGVTPGTYTTIVFALGVDQNCNTVEACTHGDLDPFSSDSEKMIWDWSLGSGYKFLRTEGSFLGNQTSASKVDGTFSFHVGANSNYKTFALSGDPIVIEKEKTTMLHIMAMTNQIFTGPNSIDLEATPNQGSAGSSNIADNYASGFFMLHHVNDPM